MLVDFNSLALLSQRGAIAGAITVYQASSGEESNEKTLQRQKTPVGRGRREEHLLA